MEMARKYYIVTKHSRLPLIAYLLTKNNVRLMVASYGTVKKAAFMLFFEINNEICALSIFCERW